MFVLPHPENERGKNTEFNSAVWHGVCFVRNGPYTGGIFKFEIEFPGHYPINPPSAKFTTPVYHPLVQPKTGLVNLDLEFKPWVPGKHWVINVMMYIKKLFHLQAFFKPDPAQGVYNKEAADKFENDFGAFHAEVKACVEKSYDDRFKQQTGSVLKFSEHIPLHDKIME